MFANAFARDCDDGRDSLLRDAALSFYDRGYSPIPCIGSRPVQPAWNVTHALTRPTREAIAASWAPVTVGTNLAITTYGAVGFVLANDWERTVSIVGKLADAPAVTRPGKGCAFFVRGSGQLAIPQRLATKLQLIWRPQRAAVQLIPPTIDERTGELVAWVDPDNTLLHWRASELPYLTSVDIDAGELALKDRAQHGECHP